MEAEPLSCAYVAGLFDGEGTVGLYRQSGGRQSFQPAIRIGLKDDTRNRAVLTRLSLQYAVNVRRSGGVVWFAITRRDTIREFIADILPYTIIKTTQLILLDAWLETKTYGFRIHQLLKSQKRRS
jgi:hypothetical protein